jgi:hypothetical protein
MAKTTITFNEQAGKRYVSEFMSVIGRMYIHIAKKYEGDGVRRIFSF